MELIAFLGTDKETFGQVAGLVNRGDWEKIFLVKNLSASSYPDPVNSESITIDSSKPLIELKEEMVRKLKDKISGFEVALSIASGYGKEHMALISALLSIPVGIRLVVFTKNGVEFIN